MLAPLPSQGPYPPGAARMMKGPYEPDGRRVLSHRQSGGGGEVCRDRSIPDKPSTGVCTVWADTSTAIRPAQQNACLLQPASNEAPEGL
jgi:hypothetical protein